MNCALWLNRRKIFSADEIRDNLDLASLCGYFTAGSLVNWLKSHGGEEYAAELEKLSPKAPDLKDQLARIFGGQPVKYKAFKSGADLSDLSDSSPSGVVSSALPSSFAGFAASSGKSGISSYPLWKLRLMGSFNFSSYSFSSYLLNIGFNFNFNFNKGGSFAFNSFSGGSFGYNWEWEWENFLAGFGSFNTNAASFVYTSFAAALRAFLAKNYGSFGSSWSYGKFGSLNFGLFGSFGSFNAFKLFGSRQNALMPASFRGSGGQCFIDSDEYDRILMECVFGCRLNAYGYGIHNV